MHEFMRRYLNVSDTPDGGQHIHKGSMVLRKLIAEQKVGVGAIVRMTLGGAVHTFHILTPFGLVNYLDSAHQVKTYEEVLDQKENGRPIPWTFDGFEFLSNDTLEDLKKGIPEKE